MSLEGFIVAIHLAIPIMGILWLGIRKERQANEKLLKQAIARTNRRRFR